MAVGDLLIKLGVDAGGVKEALQQVQKDAKESADAMKANWEAVGKASLIVGGVITGAFALSVKGAAEEEQAMLRLAASLKNVGVSFADVKGPLDSTIMSMEKMSAVSHDQLYSAFNKLLNITGSYTESLAMLPVALDLAKGANIDLETASMLVGKVTEGNTSMLARYGIVLKEGATSTEAIAAITDRFGGSAEAMGSSTSSAMEKIKLSTDALSEGIGAIFLPMLSSVANLITPIIDAIRTWTEQNPLLTTVIASVTAVLGVLLVGLGTYVMLTTSATVQTMALIIAKTAHAVAEGVTTAAIWLTNTAWITQAGALIATTAGTVAHTVAMGAQAVVTGVCTAAQWLFNAAMMANPIGLIILAVVALVAAGIALWKNWDTVTSFFIDAWITLKIAFAEGVKIIINTTLLPFLEMFGKIFGGITLAVGKVVGIFNKDLGESIEGVAQKMLNARETIGNWADDVLNAARAEQNARAIEKATGEMAANVTSDINSIPESKTINILTIMTTEQRIIQSGMAVPVAPTAPAGDTGPTGNTGTGLNTVSPTGSTSVVDIPDVNIYDPPGLAVGGVVTGPILSHVGESATRTNPEVVAPLDRLKSIIGEAGKGVANIYFQIDGRTLVSIIGQPLVDEIRLRTGVRT
jgi:hypothetical protein